MIPCTWRPPFGERIANDTIDAGYFVTNTWASKVARPPGPAAFGGLPIAQVRTTEAFIEALKNLEGRHQMLYPRANAFKGKVYVPTSRNTASTCEPIAAARNDRATRPSWGRTRQVRC